MQMEIDVHECCLTFETLEDLTS